jgi:hypothetical protein
VDGTCLAEVTVTPRADSQDGDFVQIMLAQGRYEVLQAWPTPHQWSWRLAETNCEILAWSQVSMELRLAEALPE